MGLEDKGMDPPESDKAGVVEVCTFLSGDDGEMGGDGEGEASLGDIVGSGSGETVAGCFANGDEG